MEWNYAQVRPLVQRATARKLYLFAPFHDVGEEDLQQEALLATRKAHGSFDPARAGGSRYNGPVSERKLDPQYATFMYLVAMRRILDLWRASTRRVARDAIAARKEAVWPTQPVEEGPLDEADLAEWLAGTYRACKHTYGKKQVRIGRKFYGVPKVAAVLLLMRRLGLSPKGARDLLAGREDLRQALRFRHTPGRRYFQTIADLLASKAGKFELDNGHDGEAIN